VVVLLAFAESKIASTTTLGLDFPSVWDQTPHRFGFYMAFETVEEIVYFSGVPTSHVECLCSRVIGLGTLWHSWDVVADVVLCSDGCLLSYVSFLHFCLLPGYCAPSKLQQNMISRAPGVYLYLGTPRADC
jgi:hypothetical protein